MWKCTHCNSPLPLRELGPLFIKCGLVLNTAIGIVFQSNKVMDLRILCFVTWSDTCAVYNRGTVFEEAVIQIFDTVGVIRFGFLHGGIITSWAVYLFLL